MWPELLSHGPAQTELLARIWPATQVMSISPRSTSEMVEHGSLHSSPDCRVTLTLESKHGSAVQFTVVIVVFAPSRPPSQPRSTWPL